MEEGEKREDSSKEEGERGRALREKNIVGVKKRDEREREMKRRRDRKMEGRKEEG